MRKQVLLLGLLIVGVTFIGCYSSGNNSSDNSDILGEWKDGEMGVIWNFHSDGSFREDPASSIWRNKTSTSGMYQVIGKKLILDTYEGSKHYEFTWSKPDKNRLTFGNEASGYWECERVY